MNVETPAFVIDESEVRENLDVLNKIKDKAGIEILFSIKSLAEPNMMRLIDSHVGGFSTSSLFEARLAHGIAENRERIHIVTPGLDMREIEEISKYAGHITYNSIDQAKRLNEAITKPYVAGIRVNPQISFVSEPRYNPCKVDSKLGVPIGKLKDRYKELPFVSGLHFHSNCDGHDPKQLLETVRKITTELGEWLKDLEWVNMGGGYLYNEIEDFRYFYEAVNLFKSFGLKVIIEPGATVVRSAGSMIATVTDVFTNDGKKTAMIDISVNHMPEILEYLFESDIAESVDGGKHEYTLAGPTCLAGDEFGTYPFENPLKVGDTITFREVGAYTMVKAHTFNGVNVPSIYSKLSSGELVLRKKFDYEHYESRWK